MGRAFCVGGEVRKVQFQLWVPHVSPILRDVGNLCVRINPRKERNDEPDVDRGMNDCENCQTYKQRGEWVELLFMAAAAEHGYHVLKPCGDSLEYDAAVEHGGDLIRVQIKSSSARNGTGYLCQFRRNYLVEE